MFTAIIRTIRAYIIRKLAEMVAGDIATNGLKESDIVIIDEILNQQN